ncbi:MAG: gamma-glutamyl-gamma-aminobutyrate hydrolase family protein [bacterium]|nr:gamma-glutamyl-gamma-aminobutyrate hydrolase family protein [bacterium]
MSNTIGVTFRSPAKAEPYLAALRELGAPCTEITPETPRSIDGLAGLLVTGGGADINPARYHQEPQPETDGPPDDARDEMEAGLIEAAIDAELPLLAICRGMQMFNVVHGGTLNQHLPQAALHRVKPPPGHRHEIVHTINVEPGTALATILGATEHPVNSRHHQGVDRVGANLIVSARAPDGVIEALERPGHPFALACQWHPEESIRTNPGDRKILEAFLAAL